MKESNLDRKLLTFNPNNYVDVFSLEGLHEEISSRYLELQKM